MSKAHNLENQIADQLARSRKAWADGDVETTVKADAEARRLDGELRDLRNRR